MSFLHFGVLAGLIAVAIPVVLHLLMRQKPKKLDFPALRLLQTSVRESTKRLRLRHLWLLLLRMLLIAAVVFAVARPTLPAANWMPPWWLVLGLLAILSAAIGADRFLSGRIAGSEVAAGRREHSTQRMRWLLWPATLVLALVAIGWPYAGRVAASMQAAPTAEQVDLPVAAVFVFDVSLSTGYERDGQTRLDAAADLVSEHVGQMPSGSRVAVLTNARPGNGSSVAIFQRSLSAVPSQLSRLKPTAAVRTLNETIAAAVETHRADRDRIRQTGDAAARYVRRLYVVTDLQLSAWQFPDPDGLESRLAEAESIGLFILDVGLESPQNRALIDLQLSRPEVVDGGPIVVTSRGEVTGEPSGTAAAELTLLLEGDPIVRGREEFDASRDLVFETTIDLPDQVDLAASRDGSAVDSDTRDDAPDRSDLASDIRDRTARFQQGSVVVRGSDPLAFDDRQPFTVAVAKLPRVLIVASDLEDTSQFVAALEVSGGGPSRYGLEVITTDSLAEESVAETDIVALINVVELADPQWNALRGFVAAGGGLAVFLGDVDLESFSYNRAAAQSLLPAELDVYLSRGRFDADHPIFESTGSGLIDQLQPDDVASLLETTEVRRFWKVQPGTDAQVLARLAAEQLPLLLERRIEEGIVVMMTTAIDGKPSRQRWNNLLSLPEAPWVRLAFLDRLMRYLNRTRDQRYNFVAGETPRLSLPRGATPEQPKLLSPDLLSRPLDYDEETGVARITDAVATGHYSVRRGGRTIAAFSVRPDPLESDLTRATAADLDSVLGSGRYQLARDLDELSEEIDLAEYGQEGFPFLALLAAAFYAIEMLLGARFYND